MSFILRQLYDQVSGSDRPMLTTFAVGILLCSVLYGVRLIYLLYFHPLAKFPGPRSAAISKRWLHNATLTGHPEKVFEVLHNQYGSHAIRIAPNELHLSDPSVYPIIYGSDGKYTKDKVFYKSFGPTDSVFRTSGETSYHKLMRSRIAPAFSRGAILKAQDLILDSLKDIKARLRRRGLDRPVNLYNVCRTFPPDVIVKFAFGGEANIIKNSDDEFGADLLEAFDTASVGLWSRAYIPGLARIQDLTPLDFAARFFPDIKKFKAFFEIGVRGVHTFRNGDWEQDERKPVLSGLADMPDEKLKETALAMIGGGSDTTGYTLSYACWQVLRSPDLESRLVAELDAVFEAADSDFPHLSALESSPVLNGVVKESLRCALAAPGRLPRIVPKNAKVPLSVDGKIIPPGSIVGMSAYTMHVNQDIWGSDATEFRPDRWIGEKAHGHAADMVIFSKGARNCVGQSLATAEMYMSVAYLFRNYSMRLIAGPLEWNLVDRFTALLQDPFYAHIVERFPESSA